MSIYNLKLRTKKYPRRERPPSSMRYHQGPNRSMQKKASWCINRYSAKRGVYPTYTILVWVSLLALSDIPAHL